MSCVFCKDNWDKLDIVQRFHNTYAIINPLDPVTPGHVLVIAAQHTKDASVSNQITNALFSVAGRYVRDKGIQANIITSIGPLATQTVMHTHVHIVPRTEGDNLPLPWTPQHEVKSLREASALKRILQESGGGDHSSVGLFQQSDDEYWDKRLQGES